jgi:hypothetical protein
MPPKSAVDLFEDRTTCRLCHSEDLNVAFTMEAIPHGDGYTPEAEQPAVTGLFPHPIKFCMQCGHLQTGIDVDQGFIYDNYIWKTSISPGLVDAYKDYSQEMVDKYPVKENGYCLEIGGNDGSFSGYMTQHGVTALVVDPANDIAQLCKEKGVDVIVDYFGLDTAKQIIAERGLADLIIANHVFANINDVQTIIDGVKVALDDNGVFVIQVFYSYDVVKDNLLENFNHEHPSYYYVKSLLKFFALNGFELFDVSRNDIKGGSIRCHVQKQPGSKVVSAAVAEFITREEKIGLDNIETYQSLRNHIDSTRDQFKKILSNLPEGASVASYGTSIGATVFTYQYEIGQYINYFIDDDPARHGLKTPGYHIPVYSSDKINTDNPDYVIITAPLYADIIIAKHQFYLDQGGKFIVFRPAFKLIDKDNYL